MVSTAEDLLAYGRALGTGEGLLQPEQQAERLDSFISDLPPYDQPPINGDAGLRPRPHPRSRMDRPQRFDSRSLGLVAINVR
jgi:hypothetical protein